MNEIAGMILMVMTGCGQMENGEATGLWLEEFALPYEMFVEAGYQVVLASPEGGRVPVDERSLAEGMRPHNADEALTLLEHVEALAEVIPERFDGVFFPGGHGTMFDLPDNARVHDVVRSFIESGKPTAFVCHGPAALTGVMSSSGEPIVKNKRVTGFTNEEEAAVDLTDAMPFLLETRLKELGATFSSVAKFQPHIEVDGNLITGQNPASSGPAAQALLKQLSE